MGWQELSTEHYPRNLVNGSDNGSWKERKSWINLEEIGSETNTCKPSAPCLLYTLRPAEREDRKTLLCIDCSYTITIT